MSRQANSALNSHGPLYPTRDKAVVLLVDGQPLVAEAMRRALCDEPDIEFHYCQAGLKALAAAEEIRPTVILQDLVMPDAHGLDLVKAYRANISTQNIPIIVLSMKDEALIKCNAFSAGANDYLVKIPEVVELLARIRYHSNAYTALVQRDIAYRALRCSQQELTEINLELKRLTHVDGLTSLSNRRFLSEGLASEWKHAQRIKKPLAAMMIDIDFFKLFNDTYGHVAGDEVLQKVAAGVREVCRADGDIAARYGGEEFAVVLPGRMLEEAAALADELVRHVEGLKIPHMQSATSAYVTISVGVASCMPAKAQEPSALILAADEALYHAKRGGRNKVFIG